MMTRMKRLSMMCVTIRMNDRKKTGAMLVPHVLPGIQSGSVRMQSYMILFQSSPVEIAKSNWKLMWKFVKFFHSSMTTPSSMSAKRLLPSTALMKKTSISKKNTFTSDEKDMDMVFSKD